MHLSLHTEGVQLWGKKESYRHIAVVAQHRMQSSFYATVGPPDRASAQQQEDTRLGMRGTFYSVPDTHRPGTDWSSAGCRAPAYEVPVEQQRRSRCLDRSLHGDAATQLHATEF